MKKILIGLVVIIAIGAGAAMYLSSNADGMIKDSVVQYTPPVIGADVELANVNLDPANGVASLQGMTIGNPEGFTSDHLFKMDELLVKMDVNLENLTSDVIRINEVRLDGADMIYEIGSNGNNVSQIQENIDAYLTSMGIDTNSESEKKFIIDDVYVNGTNVKIASDLLGGKGVGFSLPDLHLSGIGEKENGVLASDAIKQIWGAISGSVSKAVESEMLNNVVGDVKDEAENVVKDLEDKVADQVGDKLRGLIPPGQ
ncbi:AsmA family protein [Pseudemcibacter aquimaris]|uniref:AsmA family protein n=1 Tax=Pseudemcibacter aquimaris TaxID=2857064 RepID=UPI0020115FE8|nr:AsmA family protein [Pseudemcibacter aquimaris]MCC3860288.1 AsmA family protein [Pseudemcibacter aquimaris]WDU57613.1 AsmA family protein [Pseudemcibacter aquimaris]